MMKKVIFFFDGFTRKCISSMRAWNNKSGDAFERKW